jgi:hypothetical protein
MAQTHNEERDRNATQSLADSGIPQEFHGKTCSLEPYEWAKGIPELRTLLKECSAWQGKVVRVEDNQEKNGHRICFITARALVLRGFSVMCCTLDALTEQLVTHRKRIDFDDTDFLVVLGFYEPNFSEGNPYPVQDRHRVEWFFTNWLMAGKTLVLHTHRTPPGRAEWWSQRLRNLITTSTLSLIDA